MTLLLNNDEVERVLTPEISIQATEAIYRELAEGTAYNRPRSQVYLPAESKNHPGFHYRSLQARNAAAFCLLRRETAIAGL